MGSTENSAFLLWKLILYAKWTSEHKAKFKDRDAQNENSLRALYFLQQNAFLVDAKVTCYTVYEWTYSLQKKISKASRIQDLSRVPFVCGYVKFHSVPFMERSTRVNDVIWRKREVKEFLQGENVKTGIRSTAIGGMSNTNTTLNFSCKHQTFPITVKVKLTVKLITVNLNQWHTCIKTTDMQNMHAS